MVSTLTHAAIATAVPPSISGLPCDRQPDAFAGFRWIRTLRMQVLTTAHSYAFPLKDPRPLRPTAPWESHLLSVTHVGPVTRQRGSGRREGVDMERGGKGGRSQRAGQRVGKGKSLPKLGGVTVRDGDGVTGRLCTEASRSYTVRKAGDRGVCPRYPGVFM